MEKKITALVLALMMVCVLAGCGSSSDQVTGEIRLPVPEGFEAGNLDGVSEFYICEDGSNINLFKGDPDPTIETVTQEQLLEILGDAYEQQLGAVVSPVSFSDSDILGCPAYQFIFSIEVDGQTFTQYQMAAQSDNLYTWTLTDMTGSHAEEFQNCLKEVYLKK